MKSKRHEIKMLNRKSLEVSGVLDVCSFHSEAFHLESECGHMVIKGQNLHIKNLNLEQCLILIEGTIDQIVYQNVTSTKKTKRFIGAFFK